MLCGDYTLFSSLSLARMPVPKFPSDVVVAWFFDCSFDASAELFVCAQPTPPGFIWIQICLRSKASDTSNPAKRI